MSAFPILQEQGSDPEPPPKPATRSGRKRIEIHWEALAASAERIRLSHFDASSKAWLVQLDYGLEPAHEAQAAVDVPAGAELATQKERFEC